MCGAGNAEPKVDADEQWLARRTNEHTARRRCNEPALQ